VTFYGNYTRALTFEDVRRKIHMRRRIYVRRRIHLRRRIHVLGQ
jgi:hypothetical protein